MAVSGTFPPSSAVELILKARLMAEHWSLIIAKPDKAKRSSFVSGEFQSVSMDGLLRRLRDIAGEHFSKGEQESFVGLRAHRNRLVHFFHEAYSQAEAANGQMAVSIELNRGWFYLQRLVTQRWKTHFHSFSDRFEALNRELRHHYHYLDAKFNESADAIKALQEAGQDIVPCRFCGFTASGQEQVLGTVSQRQCVVCESSVRVLTLSCPECESAVEVYDAALADCDVCRRHLELQDLLETYDAVLTTKDDLESGLPALCTTCEYPSESVVEWDYDEFPKYLCLRDYIPLARKGRM
jgi:hypothetical protein